MEIKKEVYTWNKGELCGKALYNHHSTLFLQFLYPQDTLTVPIR